jgi:hypothetical protein
MGNGNTNELRDIIRRWEELLAPPVEAVVEDPVPTRTRNQEVCEQAPAVEAALPHDAVSPRVAPMEASAPEFAIPDGESALAPPHANPTLDSHRNRLDTTLWWTLYGLTFALAIAVLWVSGRGHWATPPMRNTSTQPGGLARLDAKELTTALGRLSNCTDSGWGAIESIAVFVDPLPDAMQNAGVSEHDLQVQTESFVSAGHVLKVSSDPSHVQGCLSVQVDGSEFEGFLDGTRVAYTVSLELRQPCFLVGTTRDKQGQLRGLRYSAMTWRKGRSGVCKSGNLRQRMQEDLNSLLLTLVDDYTEAHPGVKWAQVSETSARHRQGHLR